MNFCRSLRRTPFALCSALVCCAAFLPASAVADGDPASDVLLVEDVFHPLAPVGSKLARAPERHAPRRRVGYQLR
jgi:hypothetical protein